MTNISMARCPHWKVSHSTEHADFVSPSMGKIHSFKSVWTCDDCGQSFHPTLLTGGLIKENDDQHREIERLRTEVEQYRKWYNDQRDFSAEMIGKNEELRATVETLKRTNQLVRDNRKLYMDDCKRLRVEVERLTAELAEYEKAFLQEGFRYTNRQLEKALDEALTLLKHCRAAIDNAPRSAFGVGGDPRDGTRYYLADELLAKVHAFLAKHGRGSND